MTDVDVRSTKKGVDVTLHAKWVVVASALLTSGYFVVTTYFGNETKQDAVIAVNTTNIQTLRQQEDSRFAELVARLKAIEDGQNRMYQSQEDIKRFLMNRNASIPDDSRLAWAVPISEFESH